MKGGGAAWPVVLVSMPFMQVDRPSIQLGLLKEIGTAHGFPVRTLHANLDLAARIGVDYYRRLADTRAHLIGDWLFAPEAFGPAAPDPSAKLLAELAGELDDLGGPDRLLRTRDRDIPGYLDALLAGYPWQDVRVVGFTCTFQQNTASFALARRLKDRYPQIVTVFGGANFDGEMGPELMRTVDCADFAVSGEADTAFPRLLEALATGTDPAGVPGLLRRADGQVQTTPPGPPLAALDDLPIPDYSEYFARAAHLGLPVGDVWLPLESARGCWWGAKHHCTFCGLNATTMRFRSKSPSRVRAELATQSRRHNVFRFEAVDNILDPGYLNDLFPALIDEAHDYQLFYEIKANLTRTQLRTLARAGVTHLQPGLESLSTNVLRLMNKGVRAAQNVNLLRWARYYGITIGWNILWGFPGETAADYETQAAAIPHLRHLQPPMTADRVWLERFSPLFTRPDQFPLDRRAPELSYRYVYPATADLDRIAYFFDYTPESPLPPATYAPLARAVAAWSAAWRSTPPTLTYRSAPGHLRIDDTRHPAREGSYTFRDTLAEIYLACTDRPTTARAVHSRLTDPVPVQAIEDAFAQFQERGLMFLDDTLALSLALPATPGR